MAHFIADDCSPQSIIGDRPIPLESESAMDNLANPSTLGGKVEMDTTIERSSETSSEKLRVRALNPMLILMLIFMLVFPWIANQLPRSLQSYLSAIHK